MGQNSVEGVDCFGKIFEKFHQIGWQAEMGVMILANVHQIFTFCGTLLLSSVTLIYSY